jgi:very-short-patch-repair endonuclease
MIFNNPNQITQRRQLRKNLTSPEQRLWTKIRKQQLGVRFRRQHGIGRYIADFYCADWALIVELDGDSHFTPQAAQYDAERDRFMRSLGLTVLRFSNRDVLQDIESVLERISAARR